MIYGLPTSMATSSFIIEFDPLLSFYRYDYCYEAVMLTQLSLKFYYYNKSTISNLSLAEMRFLWLLTTEDAWA